MLDEVVVRAVCAGQRSFASRRLQDRPLKNLRTAPQTIKRRLYERFGVAEYWAIDPEVETIRIYRQEAVGFARAAELLLESGDPLTTPLLPALEVPFVKIFED